MKPSSNRKPASNRKTFWSKRLCGLLPWTVLTLSIGLPAKGVNADILSELDTKISSWHIQEAREISENVPETTSATPRGRFLLGKLFFHEGKFAEALVELRAAIEGARAELEWKNLRNLAEQAQAVYAVLARTKGKSGRFVYTYKKDLDKTLIYYAEKTLTKQLKALQKIFNDAPNYTVQIDFLPDTESLARTTGLSQEQIERTGTVGVTKYGRIMMISPRALATGYPWLDTLAHEFTHLVITRVSNGNCPIWLHEGIAKLLENQWRDLPSGTLTPEEAYLLDRAAREGRLIPLRRFHPSVAYLPNQEDAALAYAQVLSFMHYLNSKLDPKWPRQLLELLGGGLTAEQSMRESTKYTLKKLYLWWRQAVSGRRQTPVPAVSLLKRSFKRGKAPGQDSWDSLLEEDVHRRVRVGDLLRLRGHNQAAAIEYREAERLAKSPSTEISDRLAGVLLEIGDTKSAMALLRPIAELYPTHSTTFVQLGEALARDRQTEAAISALEKAISINPFHPLVHCLLRDEYKKAKRTAESIIEDEYCRGLISRTKKERSTPEILEK